MTTARTGEHLTDVTVLPRDSAEPPVRFTVLLEAPDGIDAREQASALVGQLALLDVAQVSATEPRLIAAEPEQVEPVDPGAGFAPANAVPDAPAGDPGDVLREGTAVPEPAVAPVPAAGAPVEAVYDPKTPDAYLTAIRDALRPRTIVTAPGDVETIRAALGEASPVRVVEDAAMLPGEWRVV